LIVLALLRLLLIIDLIGLLGCSTIAASAVWRVDTTELWLLHLLSVTVMRLWLM
jgi:hypothetical protein